MKTQNKGNVKISSLKDGAVIQYRMQAPYDGCFWKWAFLYKHQDKFIPCFYIEKCKPNNVGEVNSIIFDVWGDEKVYVYNVHNKKSLAELTGENSFDAVHSIATFLFKNHGITLKCKCPECENEGEIHSMIPTSYRGDGGIGIENTNFVCEDCYCSGTCPQCGEYVGADDLTGEKGECTYCREADDKAFEKSQTLFI